jgi:cyclopropane fatty-acyl-phospholipid synthase-like methyltransferase
VRIIGDVPIYVAADSCDHASRSEIFLPGDFVAGAPPDPLNDSGQKWGNPLYDWSALARDGYRWWIERMRRMLELADLFRIDHFRGFAGYWMVPAAGTAREGHWGRGPGAAVFRAAEHALGDLSVIVEDLGLITPDVRELRDELGFPGMVVLLWAFSGPADNPHRLENHRVHQVVYTSTHDTDTLAGHFRGEPAWPLLEMALSSTSPGGCAQPPKEQAVHSDSRRLAHAGPTFNAPLSDERASALVAALPISPGRHVLDLGCGAGELMLRILAAHPATTGTGVDAAREALDRGVLTAAQRGLYGRVEFVEADPTTFLDLADVVVCVAASHAWGGVDDALHRVRDCVAPGGRALYGQCFWETTPTTAAGHVIGDLPQLGDVRAAAAAASFRIERDEVSTRAEWDAYERSWRAGLEASGLPEAIASAAERRLEYEDGYRRAIGFSWLVLSPR